MYDSYSEMRGTTEMDDELWIDLSFAGNWRCEFEVDNIDYPETGEHVVIKDRVRLMARGWRYP